MVVIMQCRMYNIGIRIIGLSYAMTLPFKSQTESKLVLN